MAAAPSSKAAAIGCSWTAARSTASTIRPRMCRRNRALPLILHPSTAFSSRTRTRIMRAACRSLSMRASRGRSARRSLRATFLRLRGRRSSSTTNRSGARGAGRRRRRAGVAARCIGVRTASGGRRSPTTTSAPLLVLVPNWMSSWHPSLRGRQRSPPAACAWNSKSMRILLASSVCNMANSRKSVRSRLRSAR